MCSIYARIVRCMQECVPFIFAMESDFLPCQPDYHRYVFNSLNRFQASIPAVQLTPFSFLLSHWALQFNSIQFSAVEVNDPHIVIDKHAVTTRRHNETDNPLLLWGKSYRLFIL